MKSPICQMKFDNQKDKTLQISRFMWIVPIDVLISRMIYHFQKIQNILIALASGRQLVGMSLTAVEGLYSRHCTIKFDFNFIFEMTKIELLQFLSVGFSDQNLLRQAL